MWRRIGVLLTKFFFLIFRANYWYVNFYVLWVNAIFNILLPIGTLILLNILILRFEKNEYCRRNFNVFFMSRRIKEHFQNLEENLEQVSSNIRLRKVDIFWKKIYIFTFFLSPLLKTLILKLSISLIKYLALFTLLLLKTNIKGLLKYQQDMKFQTFFLGKR